MQSLIILHTNDIHGRIEGLARIATIVERIRAENPDVPVLYFDAGDIEDNSIRLSNLTKGVAMHRLLSASGCDATAVGNGGIMSYGYQMLPEYSAVARYPLLLANLYTPDGALVPGVQPTTLLTAGSLTLGLIGVTATGDNMSGNYYSDFGLSTPDLRQLIQKCTAQLRRDGAEAIILLSHLGLDDDRKLAADVQGEISIIIGAHSHDLLPEGEQVGNVFIVQAGEYAQHLGRLDLSWDGQQLIVQRASIQSVPETTQPAVRVLNEIDVIEAEVLRFLEGVVGALAEPLDYASDRECGMANLMADALRERMHADIAIITAGAACAGPLPAGSLRRVMLWEACPTPGNPAVVTMTGAQLAALVARGLDLDFAQERPRSLRSRPRGLMHLSGARMRNGKLLIGERPVELEQEYRVAGCDWELSDYGGYLDPQWGLKPRYEMPTILRDVLEEYVPRHSPVHVNMGRLG